MNPLNFLRCADGAIINVAQVQYFDTSALCKDRWAVTANFSTQFVNVVVCESEAEATAELDNLFLRLSIDPDDDSGTGDGELVDVTHLMSPLIPPRRSVAGFSDPFGDDEGAYKNA